jgi:hypothetical protein
MLRQSVVRYIGANTQANRCFYLTATVRVITHAALCLYGFIRTTLQTTIRLVAGLRVGFREIRRSLYFIFQAETERKNNESGRATRAQ